MKNNRSDNYSKRYFYQQQFYQVGCMNNTKTSTLVYDSPQGFVYTSFECLKSVKSERLNFDELGLACNYGSNSHTVT